MKGNFRQKVYHLVKQIPKGKVATYGQIAQLAGNPAAARAVGRFMKNNPDIKNIPCHRVVGSNGSLLGYSAGKGVVTKKELLKKENVAFAGDKVDLSLSCWDGKLSFA